MYIKYYIQRPKKAMVNKHPECAHKRLPTNENLSLLTHPCVVQTCCLTFFLLF